jgi:2-methylfumaryl-CoA isomerase
MNPHESGVPNESSIRSPRSDRRGVVVNALPLADVRVVEGASFVAVPSAGMALAQLGAEVIRVDPPGGGSDIARWPLSSSGESLFWANLNKGKRSVTIDHRTEQGRELLLALATAPGPRSGIFVDNMVGKHRLRYEELVERRPDAIHVHVQGRSDGSPAVDYTINAEVGVPQMTGPQDTDGPPMPAFFTMIEVGPK